MARSFRDLPFALSDGTSYEDELAEAVDCLGEALALCVVDNKEIPAPSKPKANEVLITPPALVAAKAALHVVARQEKLSKTALAERIHVTEAVARRLLNPRYQSKLVNIEAAMAAMGRKMVIGVA